MKSKNIFGIIFAILVAFIFPVFASAHEVYVLGAGEVDRALLAPSPNPFNAIAGNQSQFLFWGIVVALIVLVALWISFARFLQKFLHPFLMSLKKYAPLAGRLTLGLSLLASGYYRSFFGPELPVPHMLYNIDQYIPALLFLAGCLIMLGLFTRLSALVALIVFAVSVAFFHVYMLTYLNYFGEIILVLVLGGNIFSLDRAIGWETKFFKKISLFFEKYSFLILRICFGIALFFASFYAKFLHSNLALDTVADYHLTNYFHFTPLFLVLGAFIVETLFGLFFALGFEIRLTAIFFTFFLTLSILFFGEAVWPHIILFGVNIALFLHGYDDFTIEKIIFRRNKMEPIL